MTFLMPRSFEQVPDLDAAVADRVFVVDRQQIDLALPRRLGIAPHGGQLLVPKLGALGQIVVLATVGLVDGILPFVLAGMWRHHSLDLRRQVLRLRQPTGPACGPDDPGYGSMQLLGA